jgi:hypothetical protein
MVYFQSNFAVEDEAHIKFSKIPPYLPFPKGGKIPSLEKRGKGRFL